MKILSLILDSKQFSWLLLEGTIEKPVLASKLKRCKFPDDVDEGSGLLAVYQNIRLLIDEQVPDAITILQAGYSKFGKVSAARTKVEAVLQMAASEKGKTTHMVSPLTTSAFNKKLLKSESSVAKVLNGGLAFSPADTESAILAAWVKLTNE